MSSATDLDEIERTWRAAVDTIVVGLEKDKLNAASALADAQTEIEALRKTNAALVEQIQGASFVMDTTEATLENSGLPTGWRPKQTLRGDQNLTDGQVIEDADIFGRIFYTGVPVLRRCKIRGVPRAQLGTDITKNTALICAWNGSAKQIKCYQCDLVPDESSWLLDGFAGHDAYLERCKFRYLTDGISAVPTVNSGPLNIEVAGCWIGDHVFWTQAGTGFQVHPSDTKVHSDGVQLHGGTGLKIHGSTLSAMFSPKGIGRGTEDWPDQRANACVQWNNSKGNAGASDIGHNTLFGGQVHMNVGAITAAGQNLGSIHDNLMNPATARLNKAALVKMQPSPSTTFIPNLGWSNNVDPAGAPVYASRG